MFGKKFHVHSSFLIFLLPLLLTCITLYSYNTYTLVIQIQSTVNKKYKVVLQEYGRRAPGNMFFTGVFSTVGLRIIQSLDNPVRYRIHFGGVHIRKYDAERILGSTITPFI
jgi:hypothetical protein